MTNKGRELTDFYQYNIENNMIKKILTSRTVWTFVVLFVVNGVTGVHDLIPAGWLPAVDGLLSVLGIYFRVYPRV